VLRGFDPAKLESIIRYATERYHDTVTGRTIIVGKHDDMWVLIPFEMQGDVVTPVTVHATSRQQVNFRLRTGRFVNE
jgi:hypothetical protein